MGASVSLLAQQEEASPAKWAPEGTRFVTEERLRRLEALVAAVVADLDDLEEQLLD